MPDLPPHPAAERTVFPWPASLLALALVLVAAGWLFIRQATAYGERQERQDLAAVAIAAAASLDPQDVGSLRGIAADEGGAALARMHSQLRRIHDAVPRARFVYLVTLRRGQVIFLADAESAGSRDYSPPGQVYAEAPTEFTQVFIGQQPLVHGPYRDRWGEWISGLAAIRPSNGGPALAVLGIDIGAEQYQQVVAGYRSLALAVVSLFAIAAALAAAIVMILQRYNARLQDDLAELQRAQQRLQLSDAVIENMVEGVMITDARLQIESVNPAFESITGYPSAEALGHTPRILFSGKHDEAFFHTLHERVDEQGNWRGEIWNRRRNGELYPQRTSVSVLRDAAGRIRHYASLISDNTAQHRMEAQLREISAVDGLTGIANRRTFDEALAREWARARRDGRPLSLVMADIDHFKGYNDLHGHPGGDRCLQEVAAAIRASASRAGDLAARYGGEEFAVILPEMEPVAATATAEKIRASVAAQALPHGASDTAAFVTISVGVATLTPSGATPAVALVEAADRALYQAKHSGRNRVVATATGLPPACAMDTPTPPASEAAVARPREPTA